MLKINRHRISRNKNIYFLPKPVEVAPIIRRDVDGPIVAFIFGYAAVLAIYVVIFWI